MISPIEALQIIAARGCDCTYRHQLGECFEDGRWIYVDYTANRVCEACVAWLALTNAGIEVDPAATEAEMGPLLPDDRRLYRARERGARWTPDRGWVAPEPEPDKVVDLMAALEESVTAAKAARRRQIPRGV